MRQMVIGHRGLKTTPSVLVPAQVEYNIVQDNAIILCKLKGGLQP